MFLGSTIIDRIKRTTESGCHDKASVRRAFQNKFRHVSRQLLRKYALDLFRKSTAKGARLRSELVTADKGAREHANLRINVYRNQKLSQPQK
jgi:hypothetical protein